MYVVNQQLQSSSLYAIPAEGQVPLPTMEVNTPTDLEFVVHQLKKPSHRLYIQDLSIKSVAYLSICIIIYQFAMCRWILNIFSQESYSCNFFRFT